MDHALLPTDGAATDASVPTMSRRRLLSWAGRGLMAAAGLAVVGRLTLAPTVDARESSDDKDSKDSKDEKDAKKEKEQKAKEKSSTSSSAARRRRKKKKKQTAAEKAIAASPYGKYIVPGQDRYNCTDFTSQADAQGTLRLVPQDPNNLDRNRDGIACGGSEAFQDGVPGGFMMPPFDINPVPRP